MRKCSTKISVDLSTLFLFETIKDKFFGTPHIYEPITSTCHLDTKKITLTRLFDTNPSFRRVTSTRNTLYAWTFLVSCIILKEVEGFLGCSSKWRICVEVTYRSEAFWGLERSGFCVEVTGRSEEYPCWYLGDIILLISYSLSNSVCHVCYKLFLPLRSNRFFHFWE